MFGDDDEEEHSPVSGDFSNEKGRRVLKKKRTDVLSELNEDEPIVAADTQEDDDEYAHSCAYALKRQWQSIVLHVTLSTHRAKRRLRPKKEETTTFNEKSYLFGT